MPASLVEPALMVPVAPSPVEHGPWNDDPDPSPGNGASESAGTAAAKLAGSPGVGSHWRMFRWSSLAGIAAALLVAGCGGGGDPAVVSAPPPEAARAGGVWTSLGGAEALTLYVAEDGDLRFVAPGLIFRQGFTGGVRSRAAVRIAAARGASHEFACVASAYDGPSPASRLGGNYTLSARFGSTMLNVNSDSEGFGMHDNARRCTVNGRFSVIDARFNPYQAEWTLSACNVPASQPCEGVAFTGFAQLSAGTAASGAAASLVRVLYEPT